MAYLKNNNSHYKTAYLIINLSDNDIFKWKRSNEPKTTRASYCRYTCIIE